MLVTIFLLAFGQRNFKSLRLRVSAEDDAPFDDQIDSSTAVTQHWNGRTVVNILEWHAVHAHHPIVGPAFKKKTKT